MELSLQKKATPSKERLERLEKEADLKRTATGVECPMAV